MDVAAVAGCHEDLRRGVVDTAAAGSISGGAWAADYLEYVRSLGLGDLVREEPTSERFRFGDGVVHASAKLVTAPAVICGTPLLLKWHVIEEISLSLLLGRDFALEHGIVVDCRRRRLSIDGRNENMTASAKGHFSVALSPERYRELKEQFASGSWLPRKISRLGRGPARSSLPCAMP